MRALILFLCCWVSSLLSTVTGSTNSKANDLRRVETCTKEDDEQCSSSFQSTRDQFNRDGYVVLKDFFDEKNKTLLKRDWSQFSGIYWDRLFKTLHSRGKISEPNHVMNDEYITGKLRSPGYKEIVHRYPGRYELSLSPPSRTEKDDDGVQLLDGLPSLQPIIDQLEPLVLAILEQHPKYATASIEEGAKKYNVIYSLITSTPGSHNQKFHIDTKHINDKYGDNTNEEHWPAHIFNVFIPLIDITTDDLGPTQLIPKSHIESRILYNDKYKPNQKQQAHQNLKMPITPLLNVGDVLMFDFRTMHRGLENIDKRNINRPMLVLAFSIPSFEDEANWPGPSIFD